MGGDRLAAALGADPPQPDRPSDLAFFYCHAPGPPGVAARADQGRREEMAGRGMPAARKGADGPGPAPGPDLALLPPAHRAVDARPGAAGHRRRPPGPARRTALRRQQPAARGLGRHRQATRQRASDQPPGNDPGLVKVSVPEARRLARLATTPMSRAARDLGYAWSRWRRDQAPARRHDYHAQLESRPRHMTHAGRKGERHVTNRDGSTWWLSSAHQTDN